MNNETTNTVARTAQSFKGRDQYSIPRGFNPGKDIIELIKDKKVFIYSTYLNDIIPVKNIISRDANVTIMQRDSSTIKYELMYQDKDTPPNTLPSKLDKVNNPFAEYNSQIANADITIKYTLPEDLQLEIDRANKDNNKVILLTAYPSYTDCNTIDQEGVVVKSVRCHNTGNCISDNKINFDKDAHIIKEYNVKSGYDEAVKYSKNNVKSKGGNERCMYYITNIEE